VPEDPTLADLVATEGGSMEIGFTAAGEYIPIWVEHVPTGSPLEPFYYAGEVIERFDSSSLPEGASVMSARYRATEAYLLISSPKPFRATFHTFYFPGWKAYVDEEEVEITPTDCFGLVSFDVPSGEHEITLRFESTPIRSFGEAISWASLFALFFLSIVRSRRRGSNSQHATPKIGDFPLTAAQWGMLVLVAVFLILVKVGYLDRYDNPLKREFDGENVRGVSNPLLIDFGGEILLLGYDLSSEEVKAGEELTLDLYWKARHPLSSVYSAFAHVVDLDFGILAQRDSLHPGRYPTVYWEPDEYVKDRHIISIPPTTPPGRYLIVVGLYDPYSGRRLPVLTQTEGGRGDLLILQPILISDE
jgi:hypothetical protein